MRPVFSVNGTKSSGNRAAPMFQETSPNARYGKLVSSICQARFISSLAAPYAPAGIPVRIDLEHPCQSCLAGQRLAIHEACRKRCSPLVGSSPIEPIRFCDQWQKNVWINGGRTNGFSGSSGPSQSTISISSFGSSPSATLCISACG